MSSCPQLWHGGHGSSGVEMLPAGQWCTCRSEAGKKVMGVTDGAGEAVHVCFFGLPARWRGRRRRRRGQGSRHAGRLAADVSSGQAQMEMESRLRRPAARNELHERRREMNPGCCKQSSSRRIRAGRSPCGSVAAATLNKVDGRPGSRFDKDSDLGGRRERELLAPRESPLGRGGDMWIGTAACTVHLRTSKSDMIHLHGDDEMEQAGRTTGSTQRSLGHDSLGTV
ncbi:hypothetical protein K402DRAFT_114461 [Aulographum hederae CBS 113979]|uniref:Uncharacterized protein n=1 Tax=Aulographum hederae CBS 113979 TaxID=1176131 RepID=A0A6G1GWF9_9PEZI|nr:hypothetical protein K402DRAFT_114461 [Aulographum hederae CBS 113979]